jgi:hypothetical protein
MELRHVGRRAGEARQMHIVPLRGPIPRYHVNWILIRVPKNLFRDVNHSG